MDTGEIIKNMRKEKGLRQKDIAHAMTAKRSYISQVESGKTVSTPIFIKLFCLTFSVNREQFHEE